MITIELKLKNRLQANLLCMLFEDNTLQDMVNKHIEKYSMPVPKFDYASVEYDDSDFNTTHLIAFDF